MQVNGQRNAVVYALFVNAALLLAILVALLMRESPSLLPGAFAQNQPPIAGGAGVFVMPCQLSLNTWGCYLLDVDAQTLAVYQYQEKQLKFLAARNVRWDRRLTNYNTTPSPREVQELVEKGLKPPRGEMAPTDEAPKAPGEMKLEQDRQ